MGPVSLLRTLRMRLAPLANTQEARLMQVAYGGVIMAVYLAYFLPGFCKWTLSMPSDSFCLSKQVVLGPQHPPGGGSQDSESELRRRRLQGKQSARR